jgi:uncharacterized protein (DUF433 family)
VTDVIAHPHVALDSSGRWVIEGTRIPVIRIYTWHRKGVTFETLFKRYPSLTAAQILSAVAFAYDNFPWVENEQR